MHRIKIFIIVFLVLGFQLNAKDTADTKTPDQVTEQHDDQGHSHADGDDHGTHTNACGYDVSESEFNPGKTAFHHISDQNIYSIGPWHFPLPCILKSEAGWDVFSSSKFHADYHGTGEYAYNKYVIYEGQVRRITDTSFPDGLVELEGHGSLFTQDITDQETDAFDLRPTSVDVYQHCKDL